LKNFSEAQLSEMAAEFKRRLRNRSVELGSEGPGVIADLSMSVRSHFSRNFAVIVCA
jgi:hypothetical protein